MRANGPKRQSRSTPEAGGAPRSDRLRVLGAVLVAEERFDDGERVLRRALALDRAGGDRLAIARSLAQLAKAYLRQKRFAEALPLIEEATSIDQDRLGAGHPLIAEDFHDLGLIYLATEPPPTQRRFHTAIDLLDRGTGRGRRPLPISSSTSPAPSTRWGTRTRPSRYSATPATSSTPPKMTSGRASAGSDAAPDRPRQR